MSFDPAGPAASSSPNDQTFGPFLRAMARHYVLVLVVVGLAAGIAFGTVMTREDTYETSASVLVKPLPQGDATFIGIETVVDSVDPTRTIQTAAALVSTPAAAAAAAKKMGPDWSRVRVRDSVHVTPRGESYVLAITAKAPTGREAARLANAYANAALDARARIVQRNVAANIRSLRGRLAALRRTGADAGQINDLSARSEQLRALQALGSDPSLQLSQRAEVPAGPIGISKPLLLALALIGGLMLGSVAALAVEYFTRRIRDEDEIARLYPIPILAGIPKIRGRKRRRVEPQAFPAAAFEQVRLLRVQLPIGEVPTSFMITSANSGDGKTTTASALATAVALGDQDVILMDLDLRKSGTTGMFGILRPLYAPPFDASSLEQMLVQVPGIPRLRVMPAPIGDALSVERFVRQLPDLLAQAKEIASCVIVDAAPIGEVSDTLRVATACDRTVFVVRPRHTDRARFILTRDVLARTGITPVGIVVIGQRIAGSSQRYDAYKYTGVDLTQPNRMTPDEDAFGTLRGARLDR